MMKTLDILSIIIIPLPEEIVLPLSDLKACRKAHYTIHTRTLHKAAIYDVNHAFTGWHFIMKTELILLSSRYGIRFQL